MSVLSGTADEVDVRYARQATGLLATFNRAGVLTSADVHVATTLGRLAVEPSDDVLLAVALAVRAVRHGSVCVDLTTVSTTVTTDADAGLDADADPAADVDPAAQRPSVAELPWPQIDRWLGACRASPLVNSADDTPGDVATDSRGDRGADPPGDVASDSRGDRAADSPGDVASDSRGDRAADSPGDSPGAGIDRSAADPPGDRADHSPGDRLDNGAVGRPGDRAADPPTDAADADRADDVGGDARPLRLVGPLLYLDRYWRQEQLVRQELAQRGIRTPPPVDADRLAAGLRRLYPDDRADLQRLAVAAAATGWLTVIAGGPGTGKTTTVARLVALLHDLADGPLRVALAAPTGKAAARLQESFAAESERLADEGVFTAGPLPASTLHRLLGSRPGSRSRFRHDRGNRLPYDVVVVDEMSMVSLTLMSRLLEALRPQTRLVLVGDPDQLASVDAGAVLGDLVGRPRRAVADAREVVLGTAVPADLTAAPQVVDELRIDVVRLRVPHRYGGAIGELAEAIRLGSAEEVVAVLKRGDPAVELVEPTSAAQPSTDGVDALHADVVTAGRVLFAAARTGDADGALEALGRHRLLCGHRRGPYGIARWSVEVERWLAAGVDGFDTTEEWYVGRPLVITANDYETGLFNGDAGVVVADAGEGRVAVFRRGSDLVRLRPDRLSSAQTMHALTVHRSQGSQFGAVTVLLPPEDSRLLTRELLYTAVTRAQEHVRLIGTEAAVRAAVARPVVRASGLRRG